MLVSKHRRNNSQAEMVVFDVAENKAAQYVTDVDAIMKCNKLP